VPTHNAQHAATRQHRGCCILLMFRHFFEASGMPARHENNMKYFKRLWTVLQIGSDIVPFFHTVRLPFMHCSSPAHHACITRQSQMSTENPGDQARATREGFARAH
jgi:hypothetical protein